ncbi:hypothetical protein FNU76_04170 [Chitinimonas arctica]|uniref:Uncharacterized protein n=1 Tax=Chitinimonas arctica TaxID=2594795 RepID=A0A516SBT8_9NEIS|nr:hypothetical protein [Chitinimonas arctica]QDQ25612.1 hypothetical protein FNU76_04170 [Chitinimonas arctica]
MCEAIQYQGRQVWFRIEGAQLPVIRKDGAIAMLPWGLRQADRHVHLHNGANVLLQQLGEDEWKRLHPVPVRLAVERFCQVDKEGTQHWFDVAPGKLMRGVLVKWRDDARVYLLTEHRSVDNPNPRALWPVFRLADQA